MKIQYLDSAFTECHQVAKKAIQDKITPGIVLGFWQKDQPDVFFIQPWGNRIITPFTAPMTQDTVFDLASMTKLIATVSLVFTAKKKALLNLQDVIPSHPVTVQQLLSHTSGFAPFEPFWKPILEKKEPWKLSLEERKAFFKKTLQECPLQITSEERYVYSDIGYLHLGFLLEDVFQENLQTLFEKYIKNPLQLNMQYRAILSDPHLLSDENIAATQECPYRKAVMLGQVDDLNAWAMGGICGHAGLFGDAKDILRFGRFFLETWYADSEFQPFLKPPVNSLFEHTQGGLCIPSKKNTPSCGDFFSPQSVGHLGFTGVSLWMDPQKMRVACLLTNRVHPLVKENQGIKKLRPEMHNALMKDLKENHV
jgi:CubicO group peptidase (beta-lactamase class C family)